MGKTACLPRGAAGANNLSFFKAYCADNGKDNGLSRRRFVSADAAGTYGWE
jgi:hypothetical protein